jgi:hypothetical protein
MKKCRTLLWLCIVVCTDSVHGMQFEKLAPDTMRQIIASVAPDFIECRNLILSSKVLSNYAVEYMNETLCVDIPKDIMRAIVRAEKNSVKEARKLRKSIVKNGFDIDAQQLVNKTKTFLEYFEYEVKNNEKKNALNKSIRLFLASRLMVTRKREIIVSHARRFQGHQYDAQSFCQKGRHEYTYYINFYKRKKADSKSS